jgi:replicative DNA helicase
LAEIGGYDLIAELWDVCPTAGHVLTYARAVGEHSLARRLGRIGCAICDSVSDRHGPIQEIIDTAAVQIDALQTDRNATAAQPFQVAVGLALDQIDRACCPDSSSPHVETGLADLDRLLGGLYRSEMTVLAARPSLGKTALAVQIAAHVASDTKRVLFVTLEQPKEMIALRLLSQETALPVSHLRRGQITLAQQQEVKRAASILRSLPLLIVDGASPVPVHVLAAIARREHRREPLSLIIVDYLQLIEPPPGREQRHQQIGKISSRLKSLARELDVPVLAVAALNRLAEQRPDQSPRLGDLRESGSIESDADSVLLLRARDPYAPKEDQSRSILVDVAKNRNGPIGEVELTFRKSTMRFEEAFPDD